MMEASVREAVAALEKIEALSNVDWSHADRYQPRDYGEGRVDALKAVHAIAAPALRVLLAAVGGEGNQRLRASVVESAPEDRASDAEPPRSFRSDQPPPFEGDDDGYPTDEWLEALDAHKMDMRAAAGFLVEGFPAACDGIACCGVTITQEGLGKSVYFWTGGWSGAEALIGTMLGQPAIKYFHQKWERGGAYWFFVPDAILSPSPATAKPSVAGVEREEGE